MNSEALASTIPHFPRVSGMYDMPYLAYSNGIHIQFMQSWLTQEKRYIQIRVSSVIKRR